MEELMFNKEDVAGVLRGNTLKVSWFLLRAENGVVGVRETQRPLGFSSPALAVYHLDKLGELGLVEKAVHTLGHFHVAPLSILCEYVHNSASVLFDTV